MSGSSDYTKTPNLGLFKPTFNADVSNWGQHWNQNADTLDATFPNGSSGTYLPLTGGTLTGPLTLNANPSTLLGAATKGYVDTTAAAYLPLAGGTVTGNLTVSGSLFVHQNLRNGDGSAINSNFFQGNTGALWSYVLGSATAVGRLYDTTQTHNMLEWGGTKNTLKTGATLLLQPAGVWTNTTDYQLNATVFSNVTYTGTAGVGANFVPFLLQGSDNVNSTGNGSFVSVIHNMGGAAMTGSRASVIINANINAPAPSNNYLYGQNVSALNTLANGTVSDGGTFTVPRGGVFGFNNVACVRAAATGYYCCVGQEIDVYAEAQTWVKFGLHSTLSPTDNFQGLFDDFGYGLSGTTKIGTDANGVGYKTGYSFGRHLGGFWPIAHNGTMIGTQDNQTTGSGAVQDSLQAGFGLDLAYVTFNSYSLRLPGGLTVDGAGVMQLGAGLISSTSNQLRIDAAASVATATTLNAGGANYPTGVIFYFGNGGRGRVLTVDGGGAVLTYNVQQYPTFNTTSPPATLATTVPGAGAGQAVLPAGLVLNVTWDATPRSLSLNPSGAATRIGGTVGFNNTAPIAKPTVTGAKGSNAALASLLAALAAYGLVTDTTTA